jgi:sarcosine oxidase subunit gamma
MTPRSPYSDLLAATVEASPGSGLIASDRDGLGLAIVALRKGQRVALEHLVRERYGTELPRGNHRVEAHGISFAGIGPESWLTAREGGGNGWAKSCREQIGAVASITDQSDGYAVLRLTGSQVRNTLAKLIPIDVDVRAFKPGDVASTVTVHMGATLWRFNDAPDGAPVFEIAVFRSLAASFWHALSESAAQFGLGTPRHG